MQMKQISDAATGNKFSPATFPGYFWNDDFSLSPKIVNLPSLVYSLYPQCYNEEF